MERKKSSDQRHQSFVQRLSAFWRRERRTTFWAALTAAIITITITVLLRRKIMSLLAAALVSLASSCQKTIHNLQDLH
jgi:hypothetical protein